MVHVAMAVLTEPDKTGLDVVHADTAAVPTTMQVTVPVGGLPPVPVTVAVKTMLPPNEVGLLSVTTFVGVVVAPATPARPIVNPDATRTPSAKCRITARRMPIRKCCLLLMMVSLRYGGISRGPGGSIKTLGRGSPIDRD